MRPRTLLHIQLKLRPIRHIAHRATCHWRSTLFIGEAPSMVTPTFRYCIIGILYRRCEMKFRGTHGSKFTCHLIDGTYYPCLHEDNVDWRDGRGHYVEKMRETPNEKYRAFVERI